MNQDHSFHRCIEEVIIANLKTLKDMFNRELEGRADPDGVLSDFDHLIEKLKSRVDRVSDRCAAIGCFRKAKYTNIALKEDYCEYHI
jgi:hypothetical protein